VFDIMVFYFSNDIIAREAVAQKNVIQEKFISLCSSNSHFINSLETTTKSMKSTFNRFYLWGKELSTTLSVNLPILRYEEEKIHVIW
jgi:hypothetical protein